MLGFKTKGYGFESWSNRNFFLFFICLLCNNNAKEMKKMSYQLIIFIGECKNQEMPLCIKYINRKGIEVRDGISH